MPPPRNHFEYHTFACIGHNPGTTIPMNASEMVQIICLYIIYMA